MCLVVDVVIPVQWGWQANRGNKGRGLGVLVARLGVRLRGWKKLIFLFWFYYFDLINFIICFHLFRISYLILFLHFYFLYFDFFLCRTPILNLPANTPEPLLLPLLLVCDHHCPSPTRISCIYKTHSVFLMWLFYLECLTLKMKTPWSFKTLGTIHPVIQGDIPKDGIFRRGSYIYLSILIRAHILLLERYGGNEEHYVPISQTGT